MHSVALNCNITDKYASTCTCISYKEFVTFKFHYEKFTVTENNFRFTSIFRTTLIPRPPPPNAALKITGRPCFRQKSMASSDVVTGPGVPGTTATPQTDKHEHYFLIMLRKAEALGGVLVNVSATDITYKINVPYFPSAEQNILRKDRLYSYGIL
jgi:hypothetical protein